MKKFLPFLLLCFSLGGLAACDDSDKIRRNAATQENINTPQQTEIVLKDRLQQWFGSWRGAEEGSSLSIGKSGDGYGIVITKAGKEERYLGVGVAGQMKIRFRRNDQEEFLRLGTGRDSGVAALAGQAYCLIVQTGEAYCRDKI